MQDQGKRLLLAVALALGVMLVWNMVFSPKDEATDKPVPAQGSGEVLVAPTSPVADPTPAVTPPTPGAPPAAAPAVAPPRGEEQPITLSFPKFEATFSNYGGKLTSFKLTDKRFKIERKGYTPHPDGELLPLQPETGALGVNFTKASTFTLPANAEWQGQKRSDTEVVYTLSTDNLEVTKVFTIIPESYLVRMTVTTKLKAPAGATASLGLAVTSYAFQDPNKIEEGASQEGPRAWHSSTLRAGEDAEIRHTSVPALIDKPREELNILWTGFEHPYLLAAYAPKLDGQPVTKFSTADKSGLMRTDLLFPVVQAQAGTELVREVVAYLGPKNYTSLEQADANAGFATGFKETIDLGWFAFIGKPLLWLLQKFYGFFGNWGIAIILLTVLVKAATLYWTTKSMRSMKSMAALAPQMKGLQEKYKEDRQRLQAETMALYKTHNVNPIAGCLPILLQMPIWLALYRMLSSAGELYQQPFIPGWINDLTSTDPYYVLPFILIATMFGQARLTPMTGDSRQQKFIQYGMPLMFGVMAFFFPAGLTLYIFTNTVLSALHSLYMNKFDKKSIAITALLKKNAEEAAAAKDAKSVAGAKPAGGKPGAAKTGAAKPAAKPMIDVDAVESDDSDEGDGESSADADGSGSSAVARPRPSNKRKKRRR